MTQMIIAFLVSAAALLVITLTSASKKKSPSTRVDFIAQASSDLHADEDEDLVNTNESNSANIDYNYDVVGESFQRDHLVSLVRSHDAFDKGEIFATAILEPEPTNEFDPTAVKVMIEGIQVGYIPKFDSGTVTEMIRRSGLNPYEVPARLGFDTESSQPLIGVRIALTVE